MTQNAIKKKINFFLNVIDNFLLLNNFDQKILKKKNRSIIKYKQ